MLAAIGALDYFYQRQRFLSRHRMTRQEMKDEIKQSDGDPQIKARMRQLARERSRRKMLNEVPKATVVVTNPTHFAVALHYERATMRAPVVVAKGVDHMAQRIKATWV